MDVFDQADNTEKLYLASCLENFTLPEYPVLDGVPEIRLDKINKYKADLKTAVNNLGTNVFQTDIYYKLHWLNLLPNINDGADFNESFNHSVDNINNELGKLQGAKKAIIRNAFITLGVSLVAIVIGGCFRLKKDMVCENAMNLAGSLPVTSPTGKLMVRQANGEMIELVNGALLRSERPPYVGRVFRFSAVVQVLLFILLLIGLALFGLSMYLLYLAYHVLLGIEIILVDLRDEMTRNKNFYI
jgi:hypothetical protein